MRMVEIMNKRQIVLSVVLVLVFLAGCSSSLEAPSPTIDPPIEENTPAPPTLTVTLEPTVEPTSTPTPAPTLVPMDDFMQGIIFASYWKGGYSQPYSYWSLENLVKPMGANWINVHFFCYTDNYRATEVSCGINNTTTKADIRNIVNAAHELGFRVYFEIQIVFLNDPNHWSGDIGKGFYDELWDAWFDGYETYITEYATLSNELDIDMFSIGQELNGTQHRDENWREIAAAVREEYNGPIIYSPDATGGENWLDITWWDAVDAIGIHPYSIRLSDHANPTVEEMVEYLIPVVDRLEALSEQFDRPVIIDELAYQSIDGVSAGDSAYYDSYSTYEVDLQEQADVYEALIKAFESRSWWKGLFLGDYQPDTLITPPNNIFITTYGKPAENILRSFYDAEPQPAWTMPELPDVQEMDVAIIYDDHFRNNWGFWPPNDNFDLMDVYHRDTVVDGNSIVTILDSYADLRISPPKTADISEYQWIALDLYVEEDRVWDQGLRSYLPVNLMMSLFGGYYETTAFSAEITATPYIDTELKAGYWHHVVIPIDHFGPVLSNPINDISIRNISPNTVTIYLDNIQLLREKILSNCH